MRFIINVFGRTITALILLVIFNHPPALSDQIFAPQVLWDRGIASKKDPVDIANTHLGILYRDDGTIDSEGYFTTFDHPGKFFETPGLNCSGLVVSVCRFLLNHNFTLEEVTRDRLGDSGDNSPLGKDWDFGWDLVLNITDHTQRRVIMPDGKDYPLEGKNGLTLRGFDLHDQAAWRQVLAQMRPGCCYLGSISKPARRQGYQVMHYHVVLIIPDSSGGIWLYHSTRRSHAHRININTIQGIAKFMGQFGGTRSDAKKILLVEALLPQISSPTHTAALESEHKKISNPTPSDVEKHYKLAAENENKALYNPGHFASSENQPSHQENPKLPPIDARSPQIVVTHLSGKVFNSFPELGTHIPRLVENDNSRLKFWIINRGNASRDVQIILKGPDGEFHYRGQVAPRGQDLTIFYPDDFSRNPSQSLRLGQYLAEIRVDNKQWCADLFEVAMPREAKPKIVDVKIPNTVQAGKTFTISIAAQNQGAESDYGGITVSCPDPAGLKILSCKPGKVFGPGSTVLAVTTDKIRTKVPMAERWIELWGENKTYDMQVQVQAGQPGLYPIYVRCALRGVNVKSSVVLMDPQSSNTVDQQGFPVFVYNVNVR